MRRKILIPGRDVYITCASSIVGKTEKEGPLGGNFDGHSEDGTFGADTWEKSESEMQKRAYFKVLEKRKLREDGLDLLFTGDLTNQCSASSFGFSDLELPQINLYGACSTLSEEFAVASAFLGGGNADRAVCVTSSHFCTAERQFRNPVEYGGQKTPTSQRTVTGAGAFILETGAKELAFAKIEEFLVGISRDPGINDANNMGAAMAPAAADTLYRYFSVKNADPGSFDLILTGDLGYEGSRILYDLLKERGTDVSSRHADCGMMIYDREKQDAHAGGSGCGCSAVVLASYILPMMKEKKLNDVLFVATGALLSTNSVQQKRTIPGIAHLVRLTTEGI